MQEDMGHCYLMNTCRVPCLKLSPKRLTMATMALFSVSKQTFCALLICNSASVTLALHSTFFNIPWKGALTLWQCCLAATWLVAAKTAPVLAHIMCTPYNHAPVYSVTLFKATYIGCMSVKLQLATCTFWKEMTRIFFVLFLVTSRWNKGQNNTGQHRRLTLEKPILQPLLPGLKPTTFWLPVWSSTTEQSLLPKGGRLRGGLTVMH